METQPFVIERTFNAPVEKVWEAITNRDQMEQWYFKLNGFKPEVGFEFRFSGGTEATTYLHICVIIEVIPARKLTYSWRYDGYEGNTFVTWELFPEGDSTLVRLTHAGLESFPKIPDFAPGNFAMGWTDIVGRSFKEYLERE